MRISKQARRDAKQLFASCRTNSVLDETKVRQAIAQVSRIKPRGHVALLSHFERLVKLDIERRTARVESAAPLSNAQQAEVQTNLARRYGPGLTISYSQNPALLGGLRIKVGSDVYDGSVQARLRTLQESF